MKNKPYKEVNTWKRPSVEVVFINVEDEVEQEITEENFNKLDNLDNLKMCVKFEGNVVYETNTGVFGIKEYNYKLLKRKGLLFKTVEKKVDVLNWNDDKEHEAFVKWANHFRISDKIQEAVKIQLIDTYLNEIQEDNIIKPKELKYISLW